jgi:fatty acid desaturase
LYSEESELFVKETPNDAKKVADAGAKMVEADKKAMEAKKKLFEVNIMENKKFVWGLNILAVVLIFPFAYIFGKIGSLLLVDGAQNLEMDLLELWLGLLLYFLLIAVHEAIHGIFFKVFCPKTC